MTYNVQVQDAATPVLNGLMERLRSRRDLHRAMGYAAKSYILEYVLAYKNDRHKTAEKLGAEPTNFVGKAIEQLERSSTPADNEKVTIRLEHPWWARAFGAVTITPKKTYLTIPLIAEAYGHRAPEIQGLFFWTNPVTGKSFLAEAIRRNTSLKKGDPGGLKLWYLLLNVVHQDQDRERLPPDEDITKAATIGAIEFLDQLLARRDAKLVEAEGTATA